MAEPTRRSAEFEKHSQQRRATLVGEFFGWLTHNKKWWLLPILITLLLLGALVALSSTGIAPLIYTLF